MRDVTPEAIFLADKIVPMTAGPCARTAEMGVNPMPTDRVRTELHQDPNDTAVRNYLIGFLLGRSGNRLGTDR